MVITDADRFVLSGNRRCHQLPRSIMLQGFETIGVGGNCQTHRDRLCFRTRP